MCNIVYLLQGCGGAKLGVLMCDGNKKKLFSCCLMDFGHGGSLPGRMVGGFNEGAMMERIKGRDIPKVNT